MPAAAPCNCPQQGYNLSLVHYFGQMEPRAKGCKADQGQFGLERRAYSGRKPLGSLHYNVECHPRPARLVGGVLAIQFIGGSLDPFARQRAHMVAAMQHPVHGCKA